MYQLFLDLEPSNAAEQPKTNGHVDWASRGKGQRLFQRLTRVVSGLSPSDRNLLLFVAGKMANSRHHGNGSR